MTSPPPNHRPSITESPWYWAYLFCTGGLIALVLIGPKYARRQADIEQNGQKRQWAAQLAAGGDAQQPPETSESLAVRLWPLFVVLGIALGGAWYQLIRRHLQARRQATPEDEPIKVAGVDP